MEERGSAECGICILNGRLKKTNDIIGSEEELMKSVAQGLKKVGRTGASQLPFPPYRLHPRPQPVIPQRLPSDVLLLLRVHQDAFPGNPVHTGAPSAAVLVRCSFCNEQRLSPPPLLASSPTSLPLNYGRYLTSVGSFSYLLERSSLITRQQSLPVHQPL